MNKRILLTGKDGIDLLNRITTLDFKRLPVGAWNPGLILNPQGKIICYFELKPIHADSAEIAFSDPFLELLDQYTFSERYQIKPLEPVSLSMLNESERIQARIPKLGNEFFNNGETNPLEINLLNAIHDQKGCYPGQEVIEKIIAIGSPSKKLCLVKCEDAPALTTPLDLDFGKLTSFQKPFGLAIVRKTHITPGTLLKSGNFTFEVVSS